MSRLHCTCNFAGDAPASAQSFFSPVRTSACVQAKQDSHLVLSLSDPVSWIPSLASAGSPLFSLLVSYLSSPSCLSFLLSSLRVENSVSFLLFLALLSADVRMPVQERRALVSSAILLQPGPFLKAVRLLLFPRVPVNPAEFVISRNSTYVKQYLNDRSTCLRELPRAAAGHSATEPLHQQYLERLVCAAGIPTSDKDSGLLGAMPDVLGAVPPVGGQSASSLASIPRTQTGVPGLCTLAGMRLQRLLPTHTRLACDCPSEKHACFPQRSLRDSIMAPPSRCSEKSNGLPPERPAAGLAEARNSDCTLVGSAMPSAQMIPQVQALMNAARAMRPAEREKATLGRENCQTMPATPSAGTSGGQLAHCRSRCEYPQTGHGTLEGAPAVAKEKPGQDGPTLQKQEPLEIPETGAETLGVHNNCVHGNPAASWPACDRLPFSLLPDNHVKERPSFREADDSAPSCGTAAGEHLPTGQPPLTQLTEYQTPQVVEIGPDANPLWSSRDGDLVSAEALCEAPLCVRATQDRTRRESNEEQQSKRAEETADPDTSPTGPADAQIVHPSNQNADGHSAGQSTCPRVKVDVIGDAITRISCKGGDNTVLAEDSVIHDVWVG